MPSINDVFNELVGVNTRLDTVHNDLVGLAGSINGLTASVDQLVASSAGASQQLSALLNTLNAGFQNISLGISGLVSLSRYADQALKHQSEQLDTCICIGEKISDQTCYLVNEATSQTRLQIVIEKSMKRSVEILRSAYPDAALDLGRFEKLRQQIEECCPPEEPKAVCTYVPCKAPAPAGEPPQVDYPPIRWGRTEAVGGYRQVGVS